MSELAEVTPKEELGKEVARYLINFLAEKENFPNSKVNLLMKGLKGKHFLQRTDCSLDVDPNLKTSSFEIDWLEDDGSPRYKLLIPKNFKELMFKEDEENLGVNKEQLIGFLEDCFKMRWKQSGLSRDKQKKLESLKEEFEEVLDGGWKYEV